jgi:hypothetical protein
MNKEVIAPLQHASMGLLCDPRKHEEILNDLWVEWVKVVLELELENIVRRRFSGHSEGAYGRLERWADELEFIYGRRFVFAIRHLGASYWRSFILFIRSSTFSATRANSVASADSLLRAALSLIRFASSRVSSARLCQQAGSLLKSLATIRPSA